MKENTDWKARVLATGGLLMGATGLVYSFMKGPNQPEVPNGNLRATVETIETQQYKDELMACTDENILKSALGFTTGSMQDCEDEKNYVATKAADRPNFLYPEATVIPRVGS